MGFLQSLLSFHRGEMKVEPDWRALEAILGAALAADASAHEFEIVLRQAVADYYKLDINAPATLQRMAMVKNWLLSQRTVADASDLSAERRIAKRVHAYAARQNRRANAPNR